MKKTSLLKNKKFLTSLFGIFIISIMVFSMLNVYQTRDKSSEVKYKDYIFYKQNNYWISNINGNQLTFKYNPLELQNITLLPYNIPNKIYIGFDPKDFDKEIFTIKESFGLFDYADIKPVLACYEEENCPDIPLVNCKDYNVILLKYEENQTNIYIEDNCLILEGNQEDQLKYIYKLIYNILRI